MAATGARAALVAAIALGGPALASPESSPPPDYRPPTAADVCPAVAEDYELCSGDPWSGNCAEFIDDARRLGEIYRSELAAHGAWVEALQTSIWWGCGSATLADLRTLLERIGSAQARAVLAEEPYKNLPRSSPALRPTPADEERDCMAIESEAERDACAAGNLSRAKAAHAAAYATCSDKVAPGLRPALVDSETRWENLLGLECEGTGYARDECLARAYEERTQSIESMHPECASGN